MTLHYTAQEQADYEAESYKQHFESSMGFLNAHRGLRRGSFHLLMGTTGGGKSTLVRTLIRDFLFKKENTSLTLALWLSEETVADYKHQLAASIPSSNALLNTQCMSELEVSKVSQIKLFIWLELYRPDVLIFDNITTSVFYMDLSVREQGEFVKKLKTITKKINCATILVAHTSAEVSDSMERLLTINDIRGSKTISNLTEFAYILQRFEIGTGFFPTIRIVKHRSQELIHNLYLLQYERKIRAFMGDSPLQFEKFKEMFGARNKLK